MGSMFNKSKPNLKEGIVHAAGDLFPLKLMLILLTTLLDTLFYNVHLIL